MFDRDDETASLLRAATAHAEAREWHAALDCLRQAKARMIESPIHYPIETWCKLALYLSRAGRLEESMQEFDWLLADLPRRARKESFMEDPNVTFGKTRKKTIYNAVMRNGKRGIEEKRRCALKRILKAEIKTGKTVGVKISAADIG